MSSSNHDPFPMASKEAKQMASSVKGSKLSSWGTMETVAGEKGPTEAELEQNDAGNAMLKKGEGDGDDDIYAGVELEEEENPDDDFLDVPLNEHRGTPWQRRFGVASRGLKKIYDQLYGETMPISEMLRTLCLSTTLFFMIGGYWLLRSLKDPVLNAMCGVEAIPKAKMLSVFVVVGVATVYNHLLDSNIPRHHLFYLFGSFYCALFGCIALLLMHPTIGLENEQQSPYRLLGWISYCSIESFGSVMVSLFWSFANSNFTLETAKASYGVMVATAQVGSIIGPTIVNQYAATWGVAKCYLIGSLCMLLLQGSMYSYVKTYGAEERNAAPKKSKPKAGILEGLKLLYDHNYVKGIFAISALFMVEVTIVDYTMKALANDYFKSLHPCEEAMSCWDPIDRKHGVSKEATEAFTAFTGLFGQATNTLSFFLSLFGTSAVIRYLGLRLTLLLFPSLCLCVIILVRLKPTLYVTFAAMMMLKAGSYSLNNPTKEMLYQPTSTGVRYKAKSWIDMFGARGSKALGSVVTNAFSDSTSSVVSNGSLVGMAVASFLIWNARYMGKKFDEYTTTGYVVGAEEEQEVRVLTEEDGVDMAARQNDRKNTSCAIPEDGEEEVDLGFGDDDDEEDSDAAEEFDDDDGDDDDNARIARV